MNGSIPADATESARRRGDSGRADAADAVGAARDAAESRGNRGRGARHLYGAPGALPCNVQFPGYGNVSAPHALTAADTGGAPSAKYVRH